MRQWTRLLRTLLAPCADSPRLRPTLSPFAELRQSACPAGVPVVAPRDGFPRRRSGRPFTVRCVAGSVAGRRVVGRSCGSGRFGRRCPAFCAASSGAASGTALPVRATPLRFGCDPELAAPGRRALFRRGVVVRSTAVSLARCTARLFGSARHPATRQAAVSGGRRASPHFSQPFEIGHEASRWGSGPPAQAPTVVWTRATTCGRRQNRSGEHTTPERTRCPV